MPVTKLKLGQFAPDSSIKSLITGALNALRKVELPQSARFRIKSVTRNVETLQRATLDPHHNPDAVSEALEAIWMELEDLLETVLPPYTTIEDNKIVPNWEMLRQDQERSDGTDLAPPVGKHRHQNKHARPYVLETHYEDTTLYRKVRAGTGHRWLKVWSVPANEVPPVLQIEEPVNAGSGEE